MDGFFVLTSQPKEDDEEAKSLLSKLVSVGLVNLQNTRTFNSTTNGKFRDATKEFRRNKYSNSEKEKERRRKYREDPHVQQRVREYASRPEVKERKFISAKRRARINKKLLSAVDEKTKAKIIQDVMKEDE
jgi:hypothetical protein